MPTTPAFQPAFLMLVMLKAAFIYARDTPYHIFKVVISRFVLYRMILASKKKREQKNEEWTELQNVICKNGCFLAPFLLSFLLYIHGKAPTN